MCCGPCATAVLGALRPDWAVQCFWYNPNIEPAEEYRRRLGAMVTVAAAGGVPLVEGPYQPESWRATVNGWEDEPEGGQRCRICYEYRLREAVAYACAQGVDRVATTLTISPHKEAALINALGCELATAAGLQFVAGDWRKRAGFARSLALSRQLGIYRQNYCGCRYSLPSAEVRPKCR